MWWLPAGRRVKLLPACLFGEPKRYGKGFIPTGFMVAAGGGSSSSSAIDACGCGPSALRDAVSNMESHRVFNVHRYFFLNTLTRACAEYINEIARPPGADDVDDPASFIRKALIIIIGGGIVTPRVHSQLTYPDIGPA